jgi:hypothetical protein
VFALDALLQMLGDVVDWHAGQNHAFALPGHFEERRQPEVAPTVRASHRWDEADEQAADDGLPHGGQARRRWRSRQTGHLFFSIRPVGPSRAQVLQVGAGDARHQRVPVQASPGAALEVVKAQFLLELLVALLAHPALLDRTGQGAPGRAERQVREVVLALARGAPLAHQPDLGARQVAVVSPDRTMNRLPKAPPAKCVCAPPCAADDERAGRLEQGRGCDGDTHGRQRPQQSCIRSRSQTGSKANHSSGTNPLSYASGEGRTRWDRALD